MSFHTAQEPFKASDKDKNGKKDHAPTLEALERTGLITQVSGTTPREGYLYEMLLARDRSRWIAQARPATGTGPCYVVTVEGLYSLERPARLTSDCALPAGATLIRALQPVETMR